MTKKLLLFILFCLTAPLALHAKDAQIDSLLQLIDKAIDNSHQYVSAKEQRISLLRSELQKVGDDNNRYTIAYRLYEEYKPFINDSAIFYLNHCTALARKMGQEDKANECQVQLALRCSNTGMYDEALSVLGRVDATKLHGTGLGTYFFAYAHVYGELAYYTHLTDMKALYGREAARYRELALKTLPQYDNNRMQILELELMNSRQLKQSKAVNDEWLRHVEKGSHPFALVALYRYLEYKNVNDTTQMMRWLAESVLTDLRNGVTDQGSMWEMANQLLVRKDIDRAYRYISFASDCAGRFGSRQRLSQISPLLSAIANQYKLESEKNNNKLMWALGIISVMALFLFASLFYVNHQRRRLADARDDLSRSNDKLSELNTELSSLNQQLKDSNTQLLDANRVKEEYVGRFMRLCSIYMDRLDDLRKKVNKRVKHQQYAELYELTQSSEFHEQELDELYANFDSAFLHLFPNFVDSFNALLKPEEQVVLTDKNRLNTTIRIFALIRLGIDDSSKIAEFLHYSVNTIYNYRARVKNATVCDRETFEDKVKSIGSAERSQG